VSSQGQQRREWTCRTALKIPSISFDKRLWSAPIRPSERERSSILFPANNSTRSRIAVRSSTAFRVRSSSAL
jgi:hypothetical protein